MATIINNPNSDSGDGGWAVVMFGAVAVVLIVGLFVVYALPALRGMDTEPKTSIIKVELPDPVVTPAPAN
jgi:hypothetical protein